MIYAVMHSYTTDLELTAKHRPAHRQYLQSLMDKKQLIAAGPLLDDSGALIVYEAESPEAVELLIKADPFFAAAVFKSWVIKPWKIVFSSLEKFSPA